MYKWFVVMEFRGNFYVIVYISKLFKLIMCNYIWVVWSIIGNNLYVFYVFKDLLSVFVKGINCDSVIN